MQQPPPLVDVLMSRRPLPASRGTSRGDSTLLVKKWETPPPTRPTPRTFAPVRPSGSHRWGWLVAAVVVFVVAAATRPVNARASVRDHQLAATAQDLIKTLR